MARRTAIDLFAGAGGATQGLRDAGFAVVGAVELDRDAAATYRLNHPRVRLWESDVRKVSALSMRRALGLDSGELTLLKACPPCQGFSTLAGGREIDASRNDLVVDTIRFVRAFRPKAVLLENVPGLQRDDRFARLQDAMRRMGYTCMSYRVDAADFGVPQRRRRLIVMCVRSRRAALTGDLSDVLPVSAARATVRNAFEDLAAATRTGDPLDRYRHSSATVRARIAAIPPAGSRFDLSPEHQLACHVRLGGRRNATASYGRLALDAPAPTMTTRCTTPACGSFVHPIEHRGISLREAATLQTFPFTYDFVGGYDSVERQIGNAVPVIMATALGRAVIKAVAALPSLS